MAYMITDGSNSMTAIKNFLGLNLSETGETNLKLGEASKMKNFRITKDYKLEKINGYSIVYEKSGQMRANWVGKLGSTEVNIFVCGGKIYNSGTQIGTLTDDVTTIFEFNKALYFINGHEYKKWDGTQMYNLVGYGYEPKIKISTTPAGVGTDYEPINLISDFRKVSYSGDGTTATYYLPEKDITMYANDIWIDGTSTNAWTYNGTNGTITFTDPPAQGVDNVLIRYKKNNTTTSDNIVKNYYCQKYGLASDTRVFMYGNPNAKNRIYYSDLGNGVPNVTYFPATNFIDVGSSNEYVTDISRQYDRLIISKESETYYATYEQIVDSSNNTIVTFPTYPLNSSHGMVAKGQGQLLDNYVTTIDSSIVQWVNTQSRDERNAEIVSQRVQEWLNGKDLTKAVTMDYQELKEYWLAVDREVLIYNYGNSTFYLLELPIVVKTLFDYGGDIYVGSQYGKLVKFDDSTMFGENTIKAEWHSGYYDFDAEYKRKTMRRVWLTLKPWFRTSVVINYESDRNTGTDAKEVSSIRYAYGYINYTDWTYNTNYTVKPFRIKLKAKKFAFEKIILTNEKKDEKLTVNSIEIQKSYGGDVK